MVTKIELGEEKYLQENELNLNQEESKKMTGYASIDKPWEKFYSQEVLAASIPEKTMYQYLKDELMKHPNAICLEYFGNRISAKEVLEKIDEVAKSYKALGVLENDIVSIISPTTPEAIYSIYALNKIGAISNIIDPRLSVENIKSKCQYSNLIVSLSMASPKVDKVASNKNQILYFPISESFPMGLKIIYSLKEYISNKKKKNVEVESSNKKINWTEFLKLSSKTEIDTIDAPYQKDKVAVIVSTSGTTGPSKLAQLTNENINAVAWQYGNSGIHHKLGDVFLNIMPVFLSYGVVAGMHMPLTLGFETVIIPQRDLKKMGSYLLKYKPQAYLDIPSGYEALRNDPKLTKKYSLNVNVKGKNHKITIEKNADLSFLINPGVGGDHLNNQLEEKINEFLQKHNNSSYVAKGYGMTEVSSAAIVNVSKDCNSLGSVGVPFSKTLVKIINPSTGEEVKYGELGELCISTPAIFKGYYQNDEATNAEIEIDENGRKWIHTKDLFTINENGELFFHGRLKNMFVRPDGHNNHPMEINEFILMHPAVLDACTVGVDSPYHLHGKYPKSVIVLKEEYKGSEAKVQEELETLCMNEFSQRDVPYYYEFKDELPYTLGGKVDFVALEKEGIENANTTEILRKEFGDKEKIKQKKI